MELPKSKTKTVNSLSDQIMVIFGACKAGKSTFCSKMPDPLFIATEPGLNALEVYQVPVTTWTEFLDVCKSLSTDKSGFYKTIVIDTADNLYQCCETHIMEVNKITHPSDLSFGKGFSLINAEFGRVIKKLAMLPFGLIFVSHSKQKDIDTRTGKITMTTLSLPEGAKRELTKLADMILFFDTEKGKDEAGNTIEKRVIRTRASSCYDAGTRWQLPDSIPLDYQEFIKAYKESTPVEQATNKIIQQATKQQSQQFLIKDMEKKNGKQ